MRDRGEFSDFAGRGLLSMPSAHNISVTRHRTAVEWRVRAAVHVAPALAAAAEAAVWVAAVAVAAVAVEAVVMAAVAVGAAAAVVAVETLVCTAKGLP